MEAEGPREKGRGERDGERQGSLSAAEMEPRETRGRDWESQRERERQERVGETRGGPDRMPTQDTQTARIF